MHMADALISPVVGGVMWATTAALITYSSKKIKKESSDHSIPLMGVLGAFIFAAQMINFTIPGTGSSGHLGGGMVLAILLGPYESFITMASIITVQALFFADGGLLALGCNIFNMAFFSSFLVYPFVYKKIVSGNPSSVKITIGAMLSSLIVLQLGAFSVVIETLLSGISDLPFTPFLVLMQPIHLAIGLVEGLVTALLVLFIFKSRPDILSYPERESSFPLKKLIVILLIAAGITGGVISWFASSNPDGLEWSLMNVTGKTEVSSKSGNVAKVLEEVQEKTSVMPDYGFKNALSEESIQKGRWTDTLAGTSFAGLTGGVITLLILLALGVLMRRKGKIRGNTN